MVVSIFNQKGGVAKTTTATNLACALGELGKRVLLVDFDPQANSTNALGVDDENLNLSIYDLLQEFNATDRKEFSGIKVKKYIQNTSYKIDILPSDINLAEAEQTLSTLMSREMVLFKIMSFITGDYDYIFIDCPPSLGLLSINALTASDYVIVPVYPSYFSVKGIKQLLRTFDLIRDNLQPKLEIMGVVLTKYDSRTSKHREIKRDIKNLSVFKNKVFTPIRINTELEKAQDNQQPITAYNRNCNGFEDYKKLANEVISYAERK